MRIVSKLPHVVTENWEWQINGACRTLDPEIFFLPENARGANKRRCEASAKAVCAGCPIRRMCLDWALSVGEEYGVWGGSTPEERQQILNHRSTG